MKVYNSSVIKMEDVGLFTTYSKLEGFEIGRKEGIEIGRKEGFEIGRKEGFEIGRKKGIEITIAKIVINAADRGISVGDIAGFTNLSVEQVRNILANKK